MAVKLALWATAVGAVAYAYLAYNPLCASGVTMLVLAIAMAVCPADSIPGRINAALTSTFWMLLAGATAIGLLHRLGRHMQGGGIFAHTTRAILTAIVLTLLFAYGKAHGAVNGARNFPNYGEVKFPSLAGGVIRRRFDRGLCFLAAVRDV